MVPPTTSTSFFEYVGIAGLERLNTQVLAWIFSDSCKALSSDNRIDILNHLFKLQPCANVVLQTLTEDQNIDLVIKTDSHVIIVENKLKAGEHGKQLQKYEVKAKTYGENPQFFYLSLLENAISRPEWHSVTYKELYTELDQCLSQIIEKGLPNFIDSFDFLLLKGYAETLRNLLDVSTAFLNNHRQFPNVFLDGPTRKSVKAVRPAYTYTKFQHFITRNNLETAFQQLFYRQVLSITDPENILGFKWLQFGETRGVGLFEVASDIVIDHKGRQFEFRVQIQGKTVKLNFQAPGEKKEVIAPFLDIFRELRGLARDANGYIRLNAPRSTAYISFSKPLAGKEEGNWFDADIEELAERFHKEIKSGFEVARELVPRLNAL